MRLGNMIAMGSAAAGHAVFGIRRPVNVMLAVTDRCNGRCHYCQIPQRGFRDASTEQLITLIDQMKRAGTTRLGIWGGEPLLRDDIGELISHAHSLGMYVTMDSNGLLWERRRDVLGDLDHVSFALDGDKVSHEANRGQETYDTVVQAIESATKTPDLTVWTLTVLTRNNIDAIDAVLENAERFKIHAAFQVLHHNDVLGTNHEEMLPDNEEYRRAAEHLLKRKREGARISSSTQYLNALLAWPDYQITRRREKHLGVGCKAGGLFCNVDTDGKVYGCSLLIGKEEAANAFEEGFAAAFRKIPPIPCQSCCAACFTEYNYLFGLHPGCIMEWLRTTRNRKVDGDG